MLFYKGRHLIVDQNGDPVPGALANFYVTATTTRQDTYSNPDLAVGHRNANPVAADAYGFLPPIYLDSSLTYKVVITDSLGASLPDGTIDPFNSLFGSTSIEYDQTAAEAAVSVTPVNKYIPSHDVCGEFIIERYGTNTTPGTTDMSTAYANAVAVAEHFGGGIIRFPGASYKMSSNIRSGSNIRNVGNSSLGTTVSFASSVTGNNWSLQTSDSSYVFNATIEKIQVVPSASSTRGIYSPGAHQFSGLHKVMILSTAQVGFEFGSLGGPARLEIDVWCSGTAGTPAGATLSSTYTAGTTVLGVAATTAFYVDQYVAIQLNATDSVFSDQKIYVARVTAINPGVSITIDKGLPSTANSGRTVRPALVGGILNNGSINLLEKIDVEGAAAPFDACIIPRFGHVDIKEFHTEHSRDGIFCVANTADNPMRVRVGIATGANTTGYIVHARSDFNGSLELGYLTGGTQSGNGTLLNDATGEDFGTAVVSDYEWSTPNGQSHFPPMATRSLMMPNATAADWSNFGHQVLCNINLTNRIYTLLKGSSANSGSPVTSVAVAFRFNGTGYDLVLGRSPDDLGGIAEAFSLKQSINDSLQPLRVPSYTVSGVPAANIGAGSIIYVSNETGGAVLAFSDGSNWRRVTDRAVIS